MHKLRETLHEAFDVSQVVLPDVKRSPAKVVQRVVDAKVMLDIVTQLRRPKIQRAEGAE